jgi:hypothetical protein
VIQGEISERKTFFRPDAKRIFYYAIFLVRFIWVISPTIWEKTKTLHSQISWRWWPPLRAASGSGDAHGKAG